MIESQPTAPQRGTGLAFVQHWTWVAEKGLMAPASARAIRAAVSQILKIDDNWESVDVRSLDVDSLIARFRNLSEIAPPSLAAYESRFRSGLESYLAYLDNPASYQPKRRRRPDRTDPARPGRQIPSPGGGDAFRSVDGAEPKPSGDPVPTAAKLVVYPFPVRPDVFAELKLPADLTSDEAERLSRFLKAVALGGTSGSGD